jgi:hypothetical protein
VVGLCGPKSPLPRYEFQITQCSLRLLTAWFTVRSSESDATERAAELIDDTAALAYACEMVRELMQGLAHIDRSSLVKVRDETRPMVLSIPFLAACA